jgi:putative ABC transport system substrate-binding protein
MRRRDFMTLAAGAAATLGPLAARAQQPAMPVVGYVRSTPAAGFEDVGAALRQGLKEAGFVEGENITLERRYADNQLDRLPGLVADLIRRPVSVIAGNAVAAMAAKAATTTMPIVFATGTDPVQDGLVPNLNRPGGNITGTVFFGGELAAKRLELLRQLVPNATTLAALVHPLSFTTKTERTEILFAAQAMGRQLHLIDIVSERDFEPAFATIFQRGVGALFVGAGAFMNSHRRLTVALAARYKLPAIHSLRESAVIGGLMSYAASNTDAYRQAGIYVGRILKGEKPGELPVSRSTKLEFVINLKTAKALGIDIPPTLLALADEVVE